MPDIELLDVVALLEDIPKHSLTRGQMGTVVEVHEPGVYEVEFCNGNGETYAMLALPGTKLMRLHHESDAEAA